MYLMMNDCNFSHLLASFWTVPPWLSPLKCLHLRWCGNSCCCVSSSFPTDKLLNWEQERVSMSSIICVAFHWRAGLTGLLCLCWNMKRMKRSSLMIALWGVLEGFGMQMNETNALQTKSECLKQTHLVTSW